MNISLQKVLVVLLMQFGFVAAEQSDVVRVGVRCYWSCGGEGEFLARLKISASNLGWKIKEYGSKKNDNFIPTEKVDFFIHLTPSLLKAVRGQKNYAVIFHPKPPPIYDASGKLKKPLLLFDGFLFTLQDIQKIKKQFMKLGRKLNYISWYPTVQYVPYKEVESKTLTHVISHWGNRAKDQRYQKLYSLLDQAGYCHLYGKKSNKQKFPNSYQGEIPFDGVSLVKKLSEGGVNLVLHSEIHIKEGIPSGRIFEAAASSSVIICDMNRFVMKHFGDSVLYIDQTKDPVSVFGQIDGHMRWIILHPEEARAKAKRAHEIFEEKFLLEDQLLQLKEMHDTIIMGNNI